MPLRSASTTSPSNSIFSSLSAICRPPSKVMPCARIGRTAVSHHERLRGDRGHVGRLGALLTLAGLVLDPGSLVEGLVALAGDLREVDEQVLAALVGRDEPVPLRSVEPFDGTGSHVNTSLTTRERVEKRKRLRLGTRSVVLDRPEA